MSITELPRAERVEGILFQPTSGLDPAAGHVQIQYTDHTDAWQQLKMPLLEALWLLHLLDAMYTEGNMGQLRMEAIRLHEAPSERSPPRPKQH